MSRDGTSRPSARERSPDAVKVFVAGGTGAIGRRLVPMLIAAGHHVSCLARSQARASQLRSAGAEPMIGDALDERSLARAVEEAAPEAIIHQLTAIPARIDPRRFERDFALTDRLRTEATANLAAAARRGGARLIAQSIVFSYAPGPPGAVHSED